MAIGGEYFKAILGLYLVNDYWWVVYFLSVYTCISYIHVGWEKVYLNSITNWAKTNKEKQFRE